MKYFLKFCGMTRAEDLLKAASLGADAAGFIFYPPSPRSVTKEEAVGIIKKAVQMNGGRDLPLQLVGVFVNSDRNELIDTVKTAGLNRVQLHGDEEPGFCNALPFPWWKVIRMKDESSLELFQKYDCPVFLADTFSKKAYGGTGKQIDRNLLDKALTESSKIGKEIILAGGLNPENLIELTNLPVKGFDINSGVEISPGIKNHKKMIQIAALLEDKNI